MDPSYPILFRPEQSSFIMWHHTYKHDPGQIQSRLKKTFPKLYSSYPNANLATAVRGHIKISESDWAPTDWLDIDPTKTSWGWMLLVQNEDMIPEGGIPRDNLGIQGGDMLLDAKGSAEVHSGEKCSEKKYEGSYRGSDQHSEAQAYSGKDEPNRGGNAFSGGDGDLPDVDPLIDIDVADPEPDEDGTAKYIEVHLEELMDCF
ncbi:hypothetical protein GP486_003816 [Trichoglossum hirsutum]|uniref:Uncharacterized protein n=1 Tax=Trichoglossum hirsutum TaxID=265104 RepID=A0A9P8LCE6_9PEZI|nr:hypothetical protein GP486_003816 [Trichoglossum hirsutum]